MKKITMRINGSATIRNMELEERYKTMEDALGISLLSLVGNPEGETVVPDKTEQPLVAMDLGKGLAQSLEDKPTQFLVVDMSTTARRPLLMWKDQVFTKSPKLLASQFYAKHKDEIEEIDVLQDSEFDWKPYMDSYIKLISKYYDKNHIILVRSRCADWYVTHTHVRPVVRKNKKAYNNRIGQMEEYFMEKVDPYVVDICSQYFSRYSEKRGFKMGVLEKPFYHQAKRIISTIVRTQPEQRVFQNEEYYIRLGRFIKYYNNLTARNRTHLLMDDTKFLDHLVLQLGRPLLVEYESDFVEMEKRGYQSIEEILKGYDFKFAASLQECLKVVRAVENGDLYRNDVDFEQIRNYNLRVVKPFTKLIKKEVENKDWISGKVNVNVYNCMDYYQLLMAEHENKPAVAKKFIQSFGEAGEKNEIKMSFRQAKKTCGNVYQACAVTINQYYKPIQVDLWGSCITREMLNEDHGRFKIGKYAYRNCPLFAFDEPIPCDPSKFDDLSLFMNSKWRAGYTRDSFTKTLPETLKKTSSEWLLIDLYDFVCAVASYKGGMFSVDSEVMRPKFYKGIEKDCTVKAIDKVLADEEIKDRFDQFIRFIKERYGKNIIFIRADIKTRYLNCHRQFKPMRGHTKEVLVRKKKFLNKWQKYFETQMDCYVIDYARHYEADDLCVSGAAMVHYEKEFYEKGYQALHAIMYEGKKKKRYGVKSKE